MGSKLEIKGEHILYVNATPDKEYPLRILQTYRDNCNTRVTDTADGTESTSPFCKVINEAQEKRAKILDVAIRNLKDCFGITK